MMYKFIASLSLLSLSILFSHNCLSTESTPEVTLKFNSRLQVLSLFNDSTIVSERDQNDILVRRARLKASGNVDKWIKFAIQTEYSEKPGSSASDAKIIDAYINLAPKKEYQLYFGQHMAPALRQNVTHINGLMTIDRPAMVSKSLTWGTKAKARFSNLTMNNTNAGLKGSVNVRDIGATFFGVYSPNDQTHYKYYFGVYEGAETSLGERVTGRMQVNFGDSESSYFNAASYFGARNTIAVGASYDQQSDVARDWLSGEQIDYQLMSFDVFAEKPVNQGSINAELGWIQLDLDDAAQLTDQVQSNPLSSTDAKAVQGQGVYFQAAWNHGKWQPWLGWEQWQSDADNDNGSYSNARVGLTYRLAGDHAKIKIGIEQTNSDQNFSTSHGSVDSLTTFAAGIFLSI
jgi:hypothetical protein